MRANGGWTLIELLAAVAILAMLAGLTWAAAAYARERSNQARCISNLRQIGIALKLYMEDYKQADWDTEIHTLECSKFDENASELLAARWGFPSRLNQLLTSGYLKGGRDVLCCRSSKRRDHASEIDVLADYVYSRPTNWNISIGRSNYEVDHLCKLQQRLWDYPIVADIEHWSPRKGGILIALRMDGRVESKWSGAFSPRGSGVYSLFD